MAFLLAIMESLYVMTDKQIYKDMTKFWGKLFGINFALGVATGLTMEFQFGTNWSYYAHYVITSYSIHYTKLYEKGYQSFDCKRGTKYVTDIMGIV